MVSALTDFFEHIKAQLSPQLVVEKRNIAALPEPPSNAVAFLHAVCVLQGEQKVSDEGYEPYAVWVHGGDDLYSRVPKSSSVTLKGFVRRVRLGVTKSGHLAVHFVDDHADQSVCFLSVADGSVVSEFYYEGLRISVDLTGRVWTGSSYQPHTVRCYSGKGRLLRTMTMPFPPRIVAFFSDGRMVFWSSAIARGRVIYTLFFYSADGKEIQAHVCIGANVIDVKICPKTDEIYVLKEDKISVYSPKGHILRDICCGRGLMMEPSAIAVTCDGRFLVCERSACRISVWTDKGVLICHWTPLKAMPYDIVLLPYGKVAVSLFYTINEKEIHIFDL